MAKSPLPRTDLKNRAWETSREHLAAAEHRGVHQSMYVRSRRCTQGSTGGGCYTYCAGYLVPPAGYSLLLLLSSSRVNVPLPSSQVNVPLPTVDTSSIPPWVPTAYHRG